MMLMSRSCRTLTAWTLYASVLFGLFACAIQHGQMSGLTLSGLHGGFCLTVSSDSATDMGSATERSTTQLLLKMDCPLCSYGGNVALLQSSGWQLYATRDGSTLILSEPLLHAPPVKAWLAHSPRAPPSC